MKVIDLLKIRENNEKEYFEFFVKYKIDATKDDSINWVFKNGEISSRGERFYDYLESGVYKLNHTIEIIEEDKEIEELPKYADVDEKTGLACGWSFQEEKLKDKINELIKIVNEMKKNGR